MMGIKESGLQFVTDIENAVIASRADMMQGLEDVTHRINGVANNLKEFRAKVEAELAQVSTDVAEVGTGLADLKTSQTEFNTTAMEILIDLQRRIPA
ncbi:hypothetical protein [Nonomuraea recticatena]|uniref:Uncharacterized protein n=1 Tax=Nonomuraea recticatena TaxID=46178 RepID=A0ABP6EFG4_9ACTN